MENGQRIRVKEGRKLRNWCGVIFYEQRESIEAVFEGIWATGKLIYAIVGFEVCPTTGRRHAQWFVRFVSQRYFGGVRKLLPTGAHIEPCRGSISDNISYCAKDKDFREWKHKTTEHKGEFFKDCKRELGSGTPMGKLISDKCISVNEIKQVEYMSKYFAPDKIPPYVVWIWGAPGSGKTRLAMSELGSKFIKEPGHRWFDGYAGEDIVIFDDLRMGIDEWPKFPTLLRLLDRYPIRVEIKGGTVSFNPKIIFITSIFSPEESCPGNEDKEQLLRRIHDIKHV